MSRVRQWGHWFAGLGVWGLLLAAAPVRGDGIFADFTTSLGDFTCQLDYTNAPMTVANFVGLAEGSRPWLDLQTGRVRTNAFYNGLAFHRINPTGAPMIQGGSPNGLGTDGPGYKFRDEFSSNLTFSAAGVMAMANSGPNTDGAQFFITVEAVPSWNNTYTVFGGVTAGMTVVSNISSVARDMETGAPDTPVVISNVVIRRVGAAAQAFNVNAHGVPTPTALAAGVQRDPTTGAPQVIMPLEQYAGYWSFVSGDLSTWSGNNLGVQLAPPDASQTASISTPINRCISFP